MNIYENPWNTMKVVRGQEASVESSKGFYKGSGSYLKALNTHALKSVENHKDLWKYLQSMKIDEKLWKAMKIIKTIKYDDYPQRTRSQPVIEQRFL